MRVAAVALLGVALACGGPEAAPICGADAHAVPEPAPACRAEAEVQSLEARWTRLVVPTVGGTRVHVVFAPDGSVADLCGDRSPSLTSWRDRVNLAALSNEIRAEPPGAACLAGTRLSLNTLAARIAEVDYEIDRCEARTIARRGQDPSLATGDWRLQLERDLRDCWQNAQREAGELWVFDRAFSRAIPFLPSAEDASRREAIQACAPDDLVIGRSAFIQDMAVARRPEQVFDCMRRLGWTLYPGAPGEPGSTQ